MTYYEIIGEILSRVNDPLGDTYLERSKQLMFEGINMLAYGGDYIEEDIPGMLREAIVTQNTPNLTWEPEEDTELGGGKVLKILGITSTYRADELSDPFPVYRYKRIDNEYLNKMHLDSEYEPLSNEVFYIINQSANNYTDPDGSAAEDLTGTTTVGIGFYPVSRIVDGDGVMITIKFIRSPKTSAWFYGTSSTDSTDASGYLSLPYIYKVIDYATVKLNQEIAGA
jgi:hypothetical protein|tara:strand:+ start:461 stop:1138 length:678 start_codon:yes stop_codon:yes gene_type:complete